LENIVQKKKLTKSYHDYVILEPLKKILHFLTILSCNIKLVYKTGCNQKTSIY